MNISKNIKALKHYFIIFLLFHNVHFKRLTYQVPKAFLCRILSFIRNFLQDPIQDLVK